MIPNMTDNDIPLNERLKIKRVILQSKILVRGLETLLRFTEIGNNIRYT